MEKIFEWFALTIGGVSGWVIGKFSPAFPLIIIATLFVLYDAWSAYELDKRVHIMDMMNSESVWLEMEREYLRVIPRADELTTAVRPIAPQQLELSFDMADDERRYTAGDYE